MRRVPSFQCPSAYYLPPQAEYVAAHGQKYGRHTLMALSLSLSCLEVVSLKYYLCYCTVSRVRSRRILRHRTLHDDT